MKKSLLPLIKWPLLEILSSLAFLLFLSSCHDHVDSTYTYQTQIPVYMQMNTVREGEIIVEPGKPLDNPGKIYLYGDYLFINEPQKGIHLIDNTSPASPKALHFIPIPGNVDLAINDGILYADSYVEHLAYDIRNLEQIEMAKRLRDRLPN